MNNKVKDSSDKKFYFRYHHTAGDSMSVMNANEMNRNVMAISSMMYLIADLNEQLPRD